MSVKLNIQIDYGKSMHDTGVSSTIAMQLKGRRCVDIQLDSAA